MATTFFANLKRASVQSFDPDRDGRARYMQPSAPWFAYKGFREADELRTSARRQHGEHQVTLEELERERKSAADLRTLLDKKTRAAHLAESCNHVLKSALRGAKQRLRTRTEAFKDIISTTVMPSVDSLKAQLVQEKLNVAALHTSYEEREKELEELLNESTANAAILKSILTEERAAAAALHACNAQLVAKNKAMHKELTDLRACTQSFKHKNALLQIQCDSLTATTVDRNLCLKQTLVALDREKLARAVAVAEKDEMAARFEAALAEIAQMKAQQQVQQQREDDLSEELTQERDAHSRTLSGRQDLEEELTQERDAHRKTLSHRQDLEEELIQERSAHNRTRSDHQNLEEELVQEREAHDNTLSDREDLEEELDIVVAERDALQAIVDEVVIVYADELNEHSDELDESADNGDDGEETLVGGSVADFSVFEVDDDVDEDSDADLPAFEFDEDEDEDDEDDGPSPSTPTRSFDESAQSDPTAPPPFHFVSPCSIVTVGAAPGVDPLSPSRAVLTFYDLTGPVATVQTGSLVHGSLPA